MVQGPSNSVTGGVFLKKKYLILLLLIAVLIASFVFGRPLTAMIRNETLPDRIPMVMVDGKLYYDTGRESTIDGRCGTMDGEISSTVDASQVPTEDNQSNFGSDYGYQYITESTIELYINDKWMVYEHRSDSV